MDKLCRCQASADGEPKERYTLTIISRAFFDLFAADPEVACWDVETSPIKSNATHTAIDALRQLN